MPKLAGEKQLYDKRPYAFRPYYHDAEYVRRMANKSVWIAATIRQRRADLSAALECLRDMDPADIYNEARELDTEPLTMNRLLALYIVGRELKARNSVLMRRLVPHGKVKRRDVLLDASESATNKTDESEQNLEPESEFARMLAQQETLGVEIRSKDTSRHPYAACLGPARYASFSPL
jgi:hypothetical protein